jgi:hypothetical protein
MEVNSMEGLMFDYVDVDPETGEERLTTLTGQELGDLWAARDIARKGYDVSKVAELLGIGQRLAKGIAKGLVHGWLPDMEPDEFVKFDIWSYGRTHNSRYLVTVECMRYWDSEAVADPDFDYSAHVPWWELSQERLYWVRSCLDNNWREALKQDPNGSVLSFVQRDGRERYRVVTITVQEASGTAEKPWKGLIE